jgi:hypothetical protein
VALMIPAIPEAQRACDILCVQRLDRAGGVSPAYGVNGCWLQCSLQVLICLLSCSRVVTPPVVLEWHLQA